MKRIFFGLFTLSIIVIGALALLWERPIPPQLPMPVDAKPAIEQKAAPAIEYPLPDVADSSALPALDSSDDAVWAAFANLQRKLGALMLSERIVRNIVVTVDNLPRDVVAARMRPVKPVPGKFLVSREDQTLHMSSANAERYREYVRVFESIDPERLVATYIQFYPIFQKAYQELGYPNRYFNDRLIGVIDHLLDAPEPDAQAELVQPRVLYEFADPQLQAASAGHKIMMRMGPDNAKRVKARLKDIRARLVAASARVRSPS